MKRLVELINFKKVCMLITVGITFNNWPHSWLNVPLTGDVLFWVTGSGYYDPVYYYYCSLEKRWILAYLKGIKCKQPHPGFELGFSSLFPSTITIVPPKSPTFRGFKSEEWRDNLLGVTWLWGFLPSLSLVA